MKDDPVLGSLNIQREEKLSQIARIIGNGLGYGEIDKISDLQRTELMDAVEEACESWAEHENEMIGGTATTTPLQVALKELHEIDELMLDLQDGDPGDDNSEYDEL